MTTMAIPNHIKDECAGRTAEEIMVMNSAAQQDYKYVERQYENSSWGCGPKYRQKLAEISDRISHLDAYIKRMEVLQ